jgi:hypothetical protein
MKKETIRTLRFIVIVLSMRVVMDLTGFKIQFNNSSEKQKEGILNPIPESKKIQDQ